MLIKKVKQIIPVVSKVVSDLTSNSETDVPSVKAVNEGIAGSMETITNENGTALKFENGLLICFMNKVVTDQAIDSNYGNGIYRGTREWVFPVPFVEIAPAVSCTTFKWGSSGSWGSTIGTSMNSVTLVGIDIASRATGTNCLINASAIGKWK